MPYDRDQVVKAVTDYYEFLTRLHVEDDDIKWPPPEGWPSITKDRFGPLDKTDKVIELLRHLPYVQNEHDFTPTQVWPLCGCADYTGWECEIQLGRGFGKYGPDIVEYSDCLWEKLHRPHPHIITLASPAVSATAVMTASQRPELIVPRTSTVATSCVTPRMESAPSGRFGRTSTADLTGQNNALPT